MNCFVVVALRELLFMTENVRLLITAVLLKVLAAAPT